MLDKQIATFNENIIGLRDFISLIGPFIEEHHKKAVEEQNKILECFNVARKLAIETDEIKKAQYENHIKSVFDGEMIKAEIIEDENLQVDKDDEESKFAITVSVSQSVKVDQAFKGTTKTHYHKELLYKNAFIGLLSSVEWFYSQVLHYYYDKHPEAAGVKKKTLTLEDLKSFNTVEDAEKYLIDNKIEEVFRSGFDAWIDLLRDEVKLKMHYIKPFINELLEVYQRRNILVHNGGIINSIYISKVPVDLRKDLKIGDKLSITSEYLENAIQKLHIVFTLVAAELWKKLEPEEERRAIILNSIAFKNMLEKRWTVSEWLCAFIKDDNELKSRVKTVGQLNYWLSKKRSGNKLLVENEMLKADFTDKSLRYQLAIAALKEDKEEFFGLLPETLRTKSLDVEELLEYPIFEEMRNMEEFETFKTNSPEFKELKRLDSSNPKHENGQEDNVDNVIEEILKTSSIATKE